VCVSLLQIAGSGRCYVSPLFHFVRSPRRFLIVITAAAMANELTFIMIKPDGVQRGLVGDIISRFEKKGFFLKGK
jgi:hypothetical protein